jgi:hypothetical protein
MPSSNIAADFSSFSAGVGVLSACNRIIDGGKGRVLRDRSAYNWLPENSRASPSPAVQTNVGVLPNLPVGWWKESALDTACEYRRRAVTPNLFNPSSMATASSRFHHRTLVEVQQDCSVSTCS